MSELAPWGERRQLLTRVFLDPTRRGQVVVAPLLGLVERSAPIP
jgi:hypothetical protein